MVRTTFPHRNTGWKAVLPVSFARHEGHCFVTRKLSVRQDAQKMCPQRVDRSRFSFSIICSSTVVLVTSSVRPCVLSHRFKADGTLEHSLLGSRSLGSVTSGGRFLFAGSTSSRNSHRSSTSLLVHQNREGALAYGADDDDFIVDGTDLDIRGLLSQVDHLVRHHTRRTS